MLRMYDFQCSRCGKVQERLVQSGERPLSICCGAATTQLPPIVRVNMGASGAYGYYDENLEAYISTNRQRRELMRQKGVTESGGTPKPEAIIGDPPQHKDVWA